MEIQVGLFKGRHELPVKNFIFTGEVSPMDFHHMDEVAWCWVMQHTAPGDVLTLYVTGLTAATVSVIKSCMLAGVGLVLMHFDRSSGKYVPQDVLTSEGGCMYMLEVYMLTEDGALESSVNEAIEGGVPQVVLEDVIFNKKTIEYLFKDGDTRSDYYAAGYRFTWK